MMDEVHSDEDYKIDTLYKIRDNEFIFMNLLQK